VKDEINWEDGGLEITKVSFEGENEVDAKTYLNSSKRRLR